MKYDQIWKMGDLGLTDLAGTLLKLDFIRNYMGGPRRFISRLKFGQTKDLCQNSV
jgi:hypothetical protein